MANSLKDALKAAYEKKGVELPKASPPKVDEHKGHLKPQKSFQKKQQTFKSQKKPQSQTEKFITQQVALGGIKNTSSVISAYGQREPDKNQAKVSSVGYQIDFNDSPAELNFSGEPESFEYQSQTFVNNSLQASIGPWTSQIELVIGLDFGTSGVKIVIGDHVNNKAFAIPFSKSLGVQAYVLPSRLYKEKETYSLNGGSEVYRDLKLSLLAEPNDMVCQNRVVAFIALLLRHARSWLLSKHGDIYKRTEIFWKLCLGLPSADHLNSEHKSIFEKLASVAWYLSTSNETNITYSIVETALVVPNDEINASADAAEIQVIPEIAAQIYGYVVSSSFDPNAQNIYLMVDIGAGTLDSCLFKVERVRGGKWGFVFYTTEVQPNGVMNLHRNRLDWWKQVINDHNDRFDLKSVFLDELKFYTDRITKIPAKIADYFSNLRLIFNSNETDPDNIFFMNRVVAQVRGKTLWMAWKENLLSQANLAAIPMYLCGGGARMSFYKNINLQLEAALQGYSWLYTLERKLQKPERLIADGLMELDYDRLSVAYGLSFIEVGDVMKATAAPRIQNLNSVTWNDHYISKDQC